MKKRFWKIEYSITIFVIFAVVLLLIPTKFIGSKEATYISKWNDTYNKVDYMFTAMVAQADSNIVKSLHKAKTNSKREKLMVQLVKPYLRINENNQLSKDYKPVYMNGKRVMPKDNYYFENLYLTHSNTIIGIKDIKNIKKDCSAKGTGVSCSHYYRIGGEFNEE